MLTAEGCRDRRRRLWERLQPQPSLPALLLADPIHLRYLANFYVDPFSLGADFGGLLLVRPDGRATLFHDNRLPTSIQSAHVDDRQVISWYDGQSPGHGPRRLILHKALVENGGRIHDSLADPIGPAVIETIAALRRRKDPDEVEQLRACMRATEAGHSWARRNIRPAMSELDVYTGVFAACTQAVGHAAIVYGDFAVSPGPVRRGGPPTQRIVREGDMFILDYSVVLSGYRSDFTNTLVIGGRPTPEQRRLFVLCVAAMAAGEKALKAGASCRAIYQAVRGVFDAAGMGEHFPHHAGHGLGLSHPEAPFLVREATETLIAGDVITLEPGLYVQGIGGIRIEHNYLITDDGFQRLSNHEITLV
jgi:Xaa-Pro dipeptidase